MNNQIPEFQIDSYSPQEMAERLETLGGRVYLHKK